MKKLPEDFEYLKDMYNDDYFPDFLVDEVRDLIKECADYIGKGNRSTEEIQAALDRMTVGINDLEEKFDENDSELETVARDSIAVTVGKMLSYFGVEINIEEALRERNW